MKLFRTQVSGNFDAGELSQIYSLTYNPDHSSIFRPSMTQADASGTTPKPLKIYSYTFEFASNVLMEGFQYYGDSDDSVTMSNWDPSNQEFVQGLKQHKMCPGSITQYVDTTTIPDSIHTNSQYVQRTIKFRAWGRGKGKNFKWVVPPITLSSSKQNYIGWSVANISPNSDRNYLMTLTIHKWKQFT